MIKLAFCRGLGSDIMQHIFVDFEMTCWGSRDWVEGKRIPEIIEIGAVRLDESFKIKDSFCQYVKPAYTSLITRTCTKLTGIKDDLLKDSPLLKDAILVFDSWIGEEPAKIYSWGDDDRRQFVSECRQKKIFEQVPVKFRRWSDFQSIFIRLFGFSRKMSLKAAIETVDFEFEGQQHRAVDDALNGARLLELVKDKERFDKARERIANIYNKKEETFTSSIGELLAGKLSSLGL